MRKRRLRNLRRLTRSLSDPLSLTDREFVDNFRLSRELFTTLCGKILPLMQAAQRSTRIREELRVLVAITFNASGSYQRMVGANLHCGMSQPSVSLCVTEVTKILNSSDILREFIKFPQNIEERERVMQRFYELHGFPGVVGCIDGTHVAIIRPHESEEAFFNRKQYHSLNVLVICDADLQILHVDASFGGASHDSHVWNSCILRRHLEDLYEQGHLCWLLGDSGYAQRNTMMTPILGAAPNSPEENYTRIHCSARNTVERCFGVLKARWRCLLAHRTLHYSQMKAGKIVNACTVLHNMCTQAHLPVPELPEEDRRLDAERQIEQADQAVPITGGRENIVRRLWEAIN